MRRGILLTALAGMLTAGGLAACGEDDGGQSGGGVDTPMIGVILPDSASSVRWETADRRYLEEAFQAAGVEYDIQNAEGDRNQFQTLADQMITNGVDVLMIVNLDSGTGKAVLDQAAAQGVATIDYDRLTLGGNAAYYVSFDNVAVGRLQGEGLVQCLTDRGVTEPTVAYLNGAPTDNNAALFREGYDSVLRPRFDSGEYVKGPEDDVPEWDGAQAATIFEQQMTQVDDGIDAVLAANDTLGNAAITVLRRLGLNGTVPVTGQDASVQGLQNILTGDQCMTVYKPVRQEAEAAAELAIALARGEQPETSQSITDPETGQEVQAVLLEPQAIYQDNVKDVVDDGYVSVEELCVDEFAAICAEAGIS